MKKRNNVLRNTSFLLFLAYFPLIYENLRSYKVFVAKTSFKFFNNLHASECSYQLFTKNYEDKLNDQTLGK